MKRTILAVLSLMIALAAFAGCAGAVQTSSAAPSESREPAVSEEPKSSAPADGDTITVTDHNGDAVTLPREINRVVVADIFPLPSVLTVFLGSAEKLVGIHPNSMSAAQNGLLGELFPDILKADTGFMQGGDLNIEELMMLKPDVVFFSAENKELGETVRNAGLNAVAISASKWNYDVLETYNHWMELLGQIFPDSDKSTQVSDYSAQMLSMIQERTKDVADKKSVLFLFQYDDSTMVTSGKSFFGQYWADATGAKNAAEEVELDNNNAVINMEQVYKWDPDIIYITNFTAAQPDDLYNNNIGSDDWSKVKAVVNKQVYKMPLGTYRSYTPGVDTPVTLLWFAKHTYPELFEDVDVEATVKEYYNKLYGIELSEDQVTRMFNPSSDAAAKF